MVGNRCLSLFLVLAGAVSGAQEVARRSPRLVAALDLVSPGGAAARLTVEYGAPSLGGRRIFGELVPWDRIWRAGDDEATKLTTPVPLRFATARLEPGSYSLFVVPRAPESAEPWLLVLNAVADQWGAFNHEPARDVARVELAVETADRPVERLSIVWEMVGERAGLLRLAWEEKVLTAPFEVEVEPLAPEVPASPPPPLTSARPGARPRRRASRWGG